MPRLFSLVIQLVCDFPECPLPRPFDLFGRHVQRLRRLDTGQVMHVALDQAAFLIRWQLKRFDVGDRPLRCHYGYQGADFFMPAVRSGQPFLRRRAGRLGEAGFAGLRAPVFIRWLCFANLIYPT